jgi:hypothetical protein
MVLRFFVVEDLDLDLDLDFDLDLDLDFLAYLRLLTLAFAPPL